MSPRIFASAKQGASRRRPNYLSVESQNDDSSKHGYLGPSESEPWKSLGYGRPTLRPVAPFLSNAWAQKRLLIQALE